MTSPTDELIQRAEALAEKATKGTWEACRYDGRWSVGIPGADDDDSEYQDITGPLAPDYNKNAQADTAFIAAGRELVPELVRALKDALAEIDRSEKRLRLFYEAESNSLRVLSSANRRNSETIEACAKIAEAHETAGDPPPSLHGYTSGNDDACRVIAHEIRALLSNPAVAQETKE